MKCQVRSDKRSNSKVRDNSKPLLTSSQSTKLISKQQKETPLYTRNAMEIMNKLSDNYRDIREVNLNFDDNKENKIKRMGKSPSSSNLTSIKLSTPQLKKPNSNKYTKQNTKPSKRKNLTKLDAVIVIQRQFRKYLKVCELLI
jgi:hypothetical protein